MAAKNILTEALQQAIPDAAAAETELLKSIKDEELQRSVFICLMYRMDPEELKRLVDGGATSEDVIRERNAFMVSVASDQDPVIRRAEKALSQADQLQKEQQDIKEHLKNELSDVLEQARSSGEREREALREQIALLADRLECGHEEKEELKSRAEDLKRQLQESRSRMAEYEAQIGELREKNRNLEARSSMAGQLSEAQTQRLQNVYGCVRRSRKIRRSEAAVLQEMDAFREQLMNKPELNAEQKDFLLSCFEEGYPTDLIRRVMVSSLSPDQMKRFIRVYERRMEGR